MTKNIDQALKASILENIRAKAKKAREASKRRAYESDSRLFQEYDPEPDSPDLMQTVRVNDRYASVELD